MKHHNKHHIRHSLLARITLLPLAAVLGGSVFAQTSAPSALQACVAVKDNAARLACYDSATGLQTSLPLAATATAATATVPATSPVTLPSVGVAAAEIPATPAVIELSSAGRAAVQPSEITRFWDLDKSSSRDTFQIRGHRPISLAIASASAVNNQPNSPTNGAPSTAVAFSLTELKINLSVRTKLASGLLHRDDQPLSDSIWFAYSQQSYWQVFNSKLSRPFRATDHEPELIYVFGHNRPLPGGFTYRMSGAGLVHQSNGQSLPLSRSWNRVYLMAAADKITEGNHRLTLQLKGWQRLPESGGKDDNPDIANKIGRAELAGAWSFDSGAGAELRTHTLGATLRHSLKSEGNGSVKLEYLRSLGAAGSGLRFHTQLFSGYGDSLIDYNRRRTTFSVGLSLVDW